MVRPKNSFVVSAEEVSQILKIRITGKQEPPPQSGHNGECVIFYPGCSLRRLHLRWIDQCFNEPWSELEMGYYRIKFSEKKRYIESGWKAAPLCLVVAASLCAPGFVKDPVTCAENECDFELRSTLWMTRKVPLAEYRRPEQIYAAQKTAIFQEA